MPEPQRARKQTGASAPIHRWLAGPISKVAHEQIEQIAREPDVRRVCVMPDAHAGELTCNGCVVATSELVYPRLVGGDIGCGFAAAPLGFSVQAIAGSSAGTAALHSIGRVVPILRRHERANLPLECDPASLSDGSLVKAASRDGAIEFGTLGRGNHFVELARDGDDQIWAIVHSGSRAMGPRIAAHHESRAGASAPSLPSLSASGIGQAYLNDAAWAVRFAAASRAAMLQSVAQSLHSLVGAHVDPSKIVNVTHNFISQEVIDGQPRLIHRKGANPAHAGSQAIIAGSAGTFSVIAEGRGCEDALHSSSHGAGRVLSRSESVRSISTTDVRRQMQGVIFDESLASRLRSEAPGVYRDLRLVMQAQRQLVRSRIRLEPIISFKGAG